jgi:hypothetical protein
MACTQGQCPLRHGLFGRGRCCLSEVSYFIYLTIRTRASAEPSARTSSLLDGLGAQQHEARAAGAPELYEEQLSRFFGSTV